MVLGRGEESAGSCSGVAVGGVARVPDVHPVLIPKRTDSLPAVQDAVLEAHVTWLS
jgi:hypothetical protein